jgi:hypothetical protein
MQKFVIRAVGSLLCLNMIMCFLSLLNCFCRGNLEDFVECCKKYSVSYSGVSLGNRMLIEIMTVRPVLMKFQKGTRILLGI